MRAQGRGRERQQTIIVDAYCLYCRHRPVPCFPKLLKFCQDERGYGAARLEKF